MQQLIFEMTVDFQRYRHIGCHKFSEQHLPSALCPTVEVSDVAFMKIQIWISHDPRKFTRLREHVSDCILHGRLYLLYVQTLPHDMNTDVMHTKCMQAMHANSIDLHVTCDHISQVIFKKYRLLMWKYIFNGNIRN